MKFPMITAILRELYETRKELSNNKFSGVHFVNNAYRVHIDAFIPRIFNVGDGQTLWNDIRTVINIEFHSVMEWDSQTLWLTMKDPK